MSNSLKGYVPMCQAVELSGYTPSRIRQLLRAGKIKGQKIAPRLWMVHETTAKKMGEKRRLRQASKS